ncbi:MAG: hypothetical protein U0Q20_04070 [Mycobacterium sp.]
MLIPSGSWWLQENAASVRAVGLGVLVFMSHEDQQVVGGGAQFVGPQLGGLFGKKRFGPFPFVELNRRGHLVEEAVDFADVRTVDAPGGQGGGGGRQPGWQGLAVEGGARGGVLGVGDAAFGFCGGAQGGAGHGVG